MRYPGLKSPAISDVHPNEMLLSRSQLPSASAVISNWMNSAPKLRRAASWLTSSTRVKTHSDTEFLSYVQAAETAHRVLMPPGRTSTQKTTKRSKPHLFPRSPQRRRTT
jgi:hypothetical protein